MRLSDAERRLSERAFAALAGADPRAFAPSAETLAETSLTNAPATRGESAASFADVFPQKKTRADGGWGPYDYTRAHLITRRRDGTGHGTDR